MKKILYIVICLVSVMVLVGCSSSLSEEKNLSNEQWIEDIEYLDIELKKNHPDIFKYTTEKEWSESIEKLKSEVPKLSDTDIKLRISQIVASIGDAHTSMLPSELLLPVPSPVPMGKPSIDDMGGVFEFPIKCEFFDDGLRVVECDSEYEEILGSKIIAINNIDINEIINAISTLFSCDYNNEQNSSEEAKQYLNIYDFLKFFDIVDSKQAKYEFEMESKEKIVLEIKALERKHIEYISLDNKEMKTNQVPTDAINYYWVRNFKEDDILYFKLNNFTLGELDGKSLEFYKFREKLLNSINQNNYEKFVIDLRDNPGGANQVRDSIIDMMKHQTELKGEDIYVITGRRSNSASVVLAYFLQNEMGATVVGESTGGNINLFTTNNNQIELPNSKLKPLYSTKLTIRKEGYNGGVKPDIDIKQDYEDYINGIDTCYEYIKSN